MLIVLNVGEDDVADSWSNVRESIAEGTPLVVISAPIEDEISRLEVDDQRELLDGLGLEEASTTRLVRASYELLGLISFFTVGEDEVKAWTIASGTRARAAAGKIHSDIERGFHSGGGRALRRPVGAGLAGRLQRGRPAQARGERIRGCATARSCTFVSTCDGNFDCPGNAGSRAIGLGHSDPAGAPLALPACGVAVLPSVSREGQTRNTSGRVLAGSRISRRFSRLRDSPQAAFLLEVFRRERERRLRVRGVSGRDPGARGGSGGTRISAMRSPSSKMAARLEMRTLLSSRSRSASSTRVFSMTEGFTSGKTRSGSSSKARA